MEIQKEKCPASVVRVPRKAASYTTRRRVEVGLVLYAQPRNPNISSTLCGLLRMNEAMNFTFHPPITHVKRTAIASHVNINIFAR